MRAVTLSLDDVRAAAERLSEVAHRTPVLTSRTLDERTGSTAFLKAECLQRGGAFKFRGAYNTISQLDQAARERGVIAFSSGNHAQGVALAARLLGAPAVICMPSDAPAVKVAATRGYGAEVIFYDRLKDDRDAVARQIAEQRGMTLVPPYDDARIIAGAGTAKAVVTPTAACRPQWPYQGPGRSRHCSRSGGSSGAPAVLCRRAWPSPPATGSRTRRSL
jgi:threonine dehydratase